MGKTNIPYLTEAWQIVTGCTPVSAGIPFFFKQWGDMHELLSRIEELELELLQMTARCAVGHVKIETCFLCLVIGIVGGSFIVLQGNW